MFVPVPLARQIERRVPFLLKILVQPRGVAERMAFFASFGLDDAHLQRYLRYLRTRRYAVHSWQRSPEFSSEAHRAAHEAGLGVMELQQSVVDVPLETLNEKHVFPWDVVPR